MIWPQDVMAFSSTITIGLDAPALSNRYDFFVFRKVGSMRDNVCFNTRLEMTSSIGLLRSFLFFSSSIIQHFDIFAPIRI